MTREIKKKTFKEILNLYLASKVQLPDGTWDLNDKKYMESLVLSCGQHFFPKRSLPLGGEALLFLVRDTYLEVNRVIKIPRPDMPKVSLERFIRSVLTLVKLKSDYFPQVLYLSSSPFFVLLDWTPGKTLRDYILSRRLYHDEIVEIFREILRAIVLLHLHGVTHRDIRPDNIIITPEGRVKIIDFGLSRTKTDKRLTMIKALGNVYYSPPEQLIRAGEVYHPSADVYSLAKVLIFMASKQDIETRKEDNPEKDEIDARIFETMGFQLEFVPFYLQATKFRPEDRFRNAKEMLLALEKIVPSPEKIELTEEEKNNEIAFLVEALTFILSGDLYYMDIFTSPFLTRTELKNLRAMIRSHKVKKILSL